MRGTDVPVEDGVRLEVGESEAVCDEVRVTDAVCDGVRVNDAVCDGVGEFDLLLVTLAVLVRETVAEGVSDREDP